MIKQGKVSMALLSEDYHGTLALDKHPPAKDTIAKALFLGSYDPPTPVIFDSISGDRIWKHALHTLRAVEPSGMDTKAWKNILSHTKFGRVASDLCNIIVALARKMATEKCSGLDAFRA